MEKYTKIKYNFKLIIAISIINSIFGADNQKISTKKKSNNHKNNVIVFLEMFIPIYD